MNAASASVIPFVDESAMMHGYDWTGEFLHGWLLTEKFNGVRAYWDGKTMWTRGGKQVNLPEEWRVDLPEGFALDGEIWAGYEGDAFDSASQAARFGRFSDRHVFKVFDAPEVRAPLNVRLEAARDRCLLAIAQVVDEVELISLQHLADAFASVRNRGGEGLVLRDPVSPYTRGRTRAVLKFKRPQYEQLLAEFPHLAEHDR
ncbi:MAG TPA: hypothetical protein VHD61_15800 [Lacunisphaera sp.]|nr:hypothetical protein [Lacunisphaera sp.]